MNKRVTITLDAPEGVEESYINGRYYWPDNGSVETTSEDDAKVLERHGYKRSGEVELLNKTILMTMIPIDELGRSALAEALDARSVSYPRDAGRAALVEVAEIWNGGRKDRIRAEQAAAENLSQGRRPAAATTVPTTPAEPAQASSAATVFAPGDYEGYLAWKATLAAPAPAVAPVAPQPAPQAQVPAPAVAKVPLAAKLSAGAEPEEGVAKPDFKAMRWADLKGYLASRGVEHPGNASQPALAGLAEKHFAAMIAKRVAA